jgi:hypothetical protein
MPTIDYQQWHRERLEEWETTPEGERGRKPEWVEDLDATITFPDIWLIRHREKFWQGWSQAPADVSPATKEIYGTVALCDQIKGLKLDDLNEMPLHYLQFFEWLDKVVYQSYLSATQIPKNS